MSAQPQTAERRRYFRLDRTCVLRCEKFNANSLAHEGLEGSAGGLVKNLSAGGILFESSDKYEVGTLLKVELKLSGWEKFKSEFYKSDASPKPQPLVVLAKVMRVEMVEANGIYDIGLSMVAIDEGHREALNRFVKKLSTAIEGH